MENPEQQEEEQTTQEVFAEINERVKKLKIDRKDIDGLSERITRLEELIKKKEDEHEKEKTRIIGTCADCKHPVTAADAAQPVCPYCGSGKQYR